MPGWSEDITGAQEFGDLPKTAQRYMQFVADFMGVGISMISTGPKRSQTINSHRSRPKVSV